MRPRKIKIAPGPLPPNWILLQRAQHFGSTTKIRKEARVMCDAERERLYQLDKRFGTKKLLEWTIKTHPFPNRLTFTDPASENPPRSKKVLRRPLRIRSRPAST